MAEQSNSKKHILSLSFAFNDYKVVSVTNSTHFKPGDLLSIETVTAVCDDPNWEVQMVDPDIASHIFNFIRGLIPL